jgi:hypothetical protein
MASLVERKRDSRITAQGALAQRFGDERQRESLQVEPADSFGVFGIQSMPFDAMFSEFVAASA